MTTSSDQPTVEQVILAAATQGRSLELRGQAIDQPALWEDVSAFDGVMHREELAMVSAGVAEVVIIPIMFNVAPHSATSTPAVRSASSRSIAARTQANSPR